MTVAFAHKADPLIGILEISAKNKANQTWSRIFILTTDCIATGHGKSEMKHQWVLAYSKWVMIPKNRDAKGEPHYAASNSQLFTSQGSDVAVWASTGNEISTCFD